jgi:hypothetical protein
MDGRVATSILVLTKVGGVNIHNSAGAIRCLHAVTSHHQLALTCHLLVSANPIATSIVQSRVYWSVQYSKGMDPVKGMATKRDVLSRPPAWNQGSAVFSGITPAFPRSCKGSTR